MTVVEAVTAQLRDELAAVAATLAPLVSHETWRNLDLALSQRAPVLAAQLCSGDDRLAAETVVDVLGVLWRSGGPPDDWWHTPVGRACATSIGIDGSEAVSASVAGAMLGVSRGRVYQLAAGGMLARHPDGGVTRRSVMSRLAST